LLTIQLKIILAIKNQSTIIHKTKISSNQGLGNYGCRKIFFPDFQMRGWTGWNAKKRPIRPWF
jgi:hypothetical protein